MTYHEKEKLLSKIKNLYCKKGKIYRSDVMDAIVDVPVNDNSIKIAIDKVAMERQALEVHMQEDIDTENGRGYIEGKYIETQYILSILNRLD